MQTTEEVDDDLEERIAPTHSAARSSDPLSSPAASAANTRPTQRAPKPCRKPGLTEPLNAAGGFAPRSSVSLWQRGAGETIVFLWQRGAGETIICAMPLPQGYDHSDQRLYQNYGGQIYDLPAWTGDV
jgi:hypothetical protein